MRGKLIVFEGGEGGGKSTQLMRLKDWLLASSWGQKLQADVPAPWVMTTCEPGGTALGKRLRTLLLNTQDSAEVAIADRSELLLYAADRAQHVTELIQPHLARGALVLCDRYTASTLAYQGYGRGLDLRLIEQLNKIATAGVSSDLTFWLDLDVSLGLERVRQRGAAFDRMETGAVAFHQRIRDGFTAIAAQDATMVQVDAAQDPDTVAAHIQAVMAEYLQIWYPLLSQR
jgi:dTMP kinase